MGGCYSLLAGEMGRSKCSELLKQLDMLVDFVANALALADLQIVLSLSNAARHVCEALLAAILVEFAQVSRVRASERAAESPLH